MTPFAGLAAPATPTQRTISSWVVHAADYVMGWELFGRRSIRQGDWKIVWEPARIPWEPLDPEITVNRWRLYNIAHDPSERVDLARQNPDVVKAMTAHWDEYARETGVVLPDYSVGYAP
ncbi:MAG: hypothetical protein EXS38_00820 [Opitutus sp.]|nr:hypothetical protein [Opitutus sp.]